MKATELLNNALIMLGYDESEALKSRIKKRAITFINLIYADLWRIENETSEDFVPVESLSDTVHLSNVSLTDIFPYGLAMHLALSQDDGDQQQYFARIYNNKRLLLSDVKCITDVWRGQNEISCD